MKTKKMKYVVSLSLLSLTVGTSAFANSLGYTGRLSNGDGSSVTGPVTLKFDLAYMDSDGDVGSVLCTKNISNVGLTNGVFNVNIEYQAGECGSSNITNVLANVPAGEVIVIRVSDQTNSKVYSYQRILSVPYSTVSQFAKSIAQNGATNGQYLKWNGTGWVPSSLPVQAGGGSGGGSISLTAGAGISINEVSGNTEISLADGGISSDKISSVARSKLAAGTPNHVLVNGIAGEMTSLSHADFKTTLGFGTAADKDVGIDSGDLLVATGIQTCLTGKKLQYDIILNTWTCIDETSLQLTGGEMSGAIDMNGSKITAVGTPTAGGDATNKTYVDARETAANTYTDTRETAITTAYQAADTSISSAVSAVSAAVATKQDGSTILSNISGVTTDGLLIKSGSAVSTLSGPTTNGTFFKGTGSGTASWSALTHSEVQGAVDGEDLTVGSIRETWTNVATSGNVLSGANIKFSVASAGITLNLPSSPVDGEVLKFVHAAGNIETYNVTLAPAAGTTIAGMSDLALDINHVSISLIFHSATNDWRLY